MRTTGYHTCKSEGGDEAVLEHGPYHSALNVKSNRVPYLGEGFYFWEEDSEAAHRWGKAKFNRYKFKDGYTILKCKLDLEPTPGTFFDLIGNKVHCNEFRKIVELIAKVVATRYPNDKNKQRVGFYIYTLCSERDKFSFPYTSFRAMDELEDEHKVSLEYSDSDDKQLVLNVPYVLCIQDLGNGELISKEIYKQ